MLYKCKVLLDIENIDISKSNIDKTYEINDKYKLCVSIQIEKDCFFCTLTILNENEDILSNTVNRWLCDKYSINKELIKACKIYKISIENNSDEFMIKVFNNNLLSQLENPHTILNIENEFQFTNFKNDFELIDLSILLMRQDKHIDYDLKCLFVDKVSYYGYKSFDEILDEHNSNLDLDLSTKIDLIINRLIRKKNISSKKMANLFCSLSLMYFNVSSSKIRVIWSQVTSYNNEMVNERLEGLKPYFIF